jgi:muramoyltetrapeptide carboxypeptidase LdcA involved in peptidoglycan recycling
MPEVWPEHPGPVPRLHRGDRVAVLALSSGLAPAFPKVFDRGLEALRSLDLEPVVYPSATLSSEELYADPALRARELMNALEDETIGGVISAIGGYESIRLFAHYRASVFTKHPKLVLGGSDATTYLLYGRRAGTIGFYGPSVMAGFSQMDDLPSEFRDHVKRFLFGRWKRFEYAGYPKYTHGYTGWSKTGAGSISKLQPAEEGWVVLQGDRAAEGRLWGGCIEVVEFLKGTRFWPRPAFFDDSILFFETSEEKPAPERVGYMLRNYGVAGILGRVKGLLFGRPKDYTAAEVKRLHEVIVQIVAGEFGRPDLPVIANVDIGHTDPKMIVPVGGRVRVDPVLKRITLLDSPFV